MAGAIQGDAVCLATGHGDRVPLPRGRRGENVSQRKGWMCSVDWSENVLISHGGVVFHQPHGGVTRAGKSGGVASGSGLPLTGSPGPGLPGRRPPPAPRGGGFQKELLASSLPGISQAEPFSVPGLFAWENKRAVASKV